MSLRAQGKFSNGQRGIKFGSAFEKTVSAHASGSRSNICEKCSQNSACTQSGNSVNRLPISAFSKCTQRAAVRICIYSWIDSSSSAGFRELGTASGAGIESIFAGDLLGPSLNIYRNI